jgi:hypothetical protein
MRIFPQSGILLQQGNGTMMKTLALTASIITLVAISGPAFARATGTNTWYWPEVVNSSDQPMAPAYNAFDAFDNPALATQMVDPDASRYHGGPKYND